MNKLAQFFLEMLESGSIGHYEDAKFQARDSEEFSGASDEDINKAYTQAVQQYNS